MAEARMIFRNVYNTSGLRIANVQNLDVGETVLLVYGGIFPGPRRRKSCPDTLQTAGCGGRAKGVQD
ncbi:MAG: hypothetical protein QOJ99_4615 [Bryobacterales bacterium]|nr:hypothetical protein [Bryobacterales bacterium]